MGWMHLALKTSHLGMGMARVALSQCCRRASTSTVQGISATLHPGPNTTFSLGTFPTALHLTSTWLPSTLRHLSTVSTNRKRSRRRSAINSSISDAASPEYIQWQADWKSFLQLIHSKGYFSADPQISVADVGLDHGPAKRAVLNFARNNLHILSILDKGKLINLIKAGTPERPDRKTRNALKRLDASFVQGMALGPGDGGAADVQDVLRLLLAIGDAPEEEIDANTALLKASLDVLPQIVTAMK